ncbi:MAG: hypothetical protein HRU30_15020 [Rhodobacteraceae bacterium]|nr:hypothetical protein [Paracoccaceae bacterium]
MSSTLLDNFTQRRGFKTFSICSNDVEAWEAAGVGDRWNWHVHSAGNVADTCKLVKAGLLDVVALRVHADTHKFIRTFANLSSTKTANLPVLLSYGTGATCRDRDAIAGAGSEIHAATFDGVIDCLIRIEKHLQAVRHIQQ